MSRKLPTNSRTLDSLLLAFDRQWHSEGRADITAHLKYAEPLQRAEALRELVKIDLQNHWTQGSGRHLEDYLAEYLELGSSEEVWSELLEEELIARCIVGNRLEEEELSSRFGDRANAVWKRWAEICQQRGQACRSTAPNIVGFASAMDLRATVLQGRYEIRELVGQGCYADVFRAWDNTLRREVAVKISRMPLAEGSDEAKRFLREAESIAQLQHPGIISIFEFGRHERQQFLVEELMTGGTLNERLADGPIAPNQAVNWMKQICDAVDYAHLCGVIHRDLKPANILVDQRGNLRVGDFGLAVGREAACRLTQDGTILGTPAYMSPEQVRGDSAVSPATDVYSLGAILYQMLTGAVPFTGLPTSVMNQIAHVDPIRPRQRNSSIPKDLEIICLKALAKEPNRRYASARDLGEDLGRFLDKLPLKARKTGWLEFIRLWVRRQPAMAAVVATAAFLIAAILLVSLIRITGERNRFRSERDRSNALLHRSLRANLQNELRVKAGGWYERAMDLLRTASTTPDPDAGKAELRDLAAEVLLDASPRLAWVAKFEPDKKLGGQHSAAAVALDDDASHVLTGRSDGSVEWMRIADHQVHLVGKLEAPVRAVAFDKTHSGVFALANSQLWRWSVDAKSFEGKHDDRQEASGFKLAEDVTVFEIDSTNQWLACGRVDGEIVIYRILGDRIEFERRWQAHAGPLVDISLSADGFLCASSGHDRFAKCWESNSGSLICSYLAADAPRSLGFNFDGTKLVWASFEAFSLFSMALTGGVENYGQWSKAYRGVRDIGSKQQVTISTDGHVTLWQNRRPVAEVSSLGEPVSLAVSKSEKRLVAGYASGLVCVWQLAKSDVCERFRSIHSLDLDSQGNAWNEAGRLNETGSHVVLNQFQLNDVLALAAGHEKDFVVLTNRDRQLLRWDGVKAQSIDLPGNSSAITVAIGNRDQWIVASSESGPVVVFDLESLALIREIPVQLGKIYSVAVNSAGTEIVVAGKTGTELIQEDGSRTVLNKHVQFAGAVAFGPVTIAVPLSDGRIQFFSTDGQRDFGVLPSYKQGIKDTCFSPDGQQLYCLYANNEVACWDWKNKSLIQRVSLEGVAHRLVVDPLGEYLLALTFARYCKVLDAKSLQPYAQISPFRGFAGFSPDGTKLRHASFGLLSLDRSAFEKISKAGDTLGTQEVVIEADYVQFMPGGHLDTVWSVDVSPDDRWTVTGSFDQKVKIWDNQTGNMKTSFDHHQAMVWRVRFSPDSSLIASASIDRNEENGEVILWRPDTQKEICRWKQGGRLVAGLDFHPSHPWLVSSTFDGHVGIAHIETQQWLTQHQPFHQAIMDVQFSRCGNFLAAACLGNGVALWPVTKPDDTHAFPPLSDPQILVEPDERVWAVAFSQDNRILAAGCESGKVVFYDVESRQRIAALQTGSSRIRYLRFSPSDSKLWGSVFVDEGFVIDLSKLRSELQQLKLDW